MAHVCPAECKACIFRAEPRGPFAVQPSEYRKKQAFRLRRLSPVHIVLRTFPHAGEQQQYAAGQSRRLISPGKRGRLARRRTAAAVLRCSDFPGMFSACRAKDEIPGQAFF
jgi:hypothetical protein